MADTRKGNSTGKTRRKILHISAVLLAVPALALILSIGVSLYSQARYLAVFETSLNSSIWTAQKHILPASLIEPDKNLVSFYGAIFPTAGSTSPVNNSSIEPAYPADPDFIPSIFPTKGWISSLYGPRKSSSFRKMPSGPRPMRKGIYFHPGVDIAAFKGTTVRAAASGKVEFGINDPAYGRTIKLDHLNGFETIYAHLNRILVREGMDVKKGQKIGLVGNTGRSTGSHLHFEVKFRGKKINPLKLLPSKM